MDLCIPEVVTVSHKCTYGGCYPEDQKVQKILDWLHCTSLTEVCGFLGVCGFVRIWVKDFAKHARLLVVLTKKDMEFMWGPEQEKAMADLKQAIIMAPCLWLIDYCCDRMVILAVDSSCIVTGFIILQLGANGRWYPSCFGSITWNDQKSCYSQAKIEIYSLWCSLQAYQLYIIGIRNLRVEINASYIKGMLNNLDIQPGTAMNRWIVRIKFFFFFFHFELIHVPRSSHTGPDGLSVCAPSPDPIVDDNTDEWLDRTMGFAVVLMNTTTPWTSWLGLPHQPDDQVFLPWVVCGMGFDLFSLSPSRR